MTESFIQEIQEALSDSSGKCSCPQCFRKTRLLMEALNKLLLAEILIKHTCQYGTQQIHNDLIAFLGDLR